MADGAPGEAQEARRAVEENGEGGDGEEGVGDGLRNDGEAGRGGKEAVPEMQLNEPGREGEEEEEAGARTPALCS